jgi:hypothetical protein
MRAELAEVGARGFDSYPFSASGTMVQADLLRQAGMEFFVGYLGAVTPERLKNVLDAGMAFMPVTFAGAYDPARTVSQLQALGIPRNVTVWLDLELGKTDPRTVDVPALEAKIDAWANGVDAAYFEPGLYQGDPQPLTSDELWVRKVRRYWHALSGGWDRNYAVAQPKSGYCMRQTYPSIVWRGTGVLVDVNSISKDFMGRLPTWVVK